MLAGGHSTVTRATANVMGLEILAPIVAEIRVQLTGLDPQRLEDRQRVLVGQIPEGFAPVARLEIAEPLGVSNHALTPDDRAPLRAR